MNEAEDFLQKKIKSYDVEHIVILFDTIEKFFKSDAGEFISNKLPPEYKKPNFQNSYNELKKRFLDVYSKLPDLEKLEKAYMPLMELLNYKENRIHWFTTNYDPTLDYLCVKKLSDHYISGFPNNEWRPESLTPEKAGIYAYFLHGSMAIHLREDGDIVFARNYKMNPKLENNILIYPGLTKKYEKDSIFEFYYNALKDRLKRSSLAMVIGFSFRDQEIKAIFERAFEENPEFKLVVVDPHIDEPDKLPEGSELPELKKKLGKRCITIPKPFGDGKNLVEEIKKLFGKDKSLAREVIEKFEKGNKFLD